MFSKKGSKLRRAASLKGTAARTTRRTLLGVEQLEGRQMLSSVPFGAMPMDTGEFMLGDVLVTVVLMESSENTSDVNPNSEDWRPETIEAAKHKVAEGIRWWEQTLATQFPANTAPLKFQFDFTHADTPVRTDVEPIANPSTFFATYVDPTTGMAQRGWIYDFLRMVGHDTTGDFSHDIRAFNHQQRLAHGTDWAFTVLVVNDENDADGMFAPGGFSRAFAYAGGRFFVSPAGRPPSTFAHETGHMFWALDEYPGVSSYYAQRGYYNTQNLNAVQNNPIPPSQFVMMQHDSIMSKDYSRQEMVNLTGGQWQEESGRPVLTWAWERNTSAPSTLAMIGWQDTSGNGILDVLDVPFTLTGSGYLDTFNDVYRFVGTSAVQTLPNRNPSGLQSDVTINRIRQAQYRLDGGPWQTAATYGAHRVNLDLRIPWPDSGVHTIEIRTVDDRTGVTSPVFTGNTGQLDALQKPGINGFVWNDVNQDGVFGLGERPVSGWPVRLIDESDQPLNLMERVEPDNFPNNARLDNADPAVTLRALVYGSYQGVVASSSPTSSTGSRVFGYLLFPSSSSGISDWDQHAQLRADFASPVSVVQLDAIAVSSTAAARLEAYDANDNLLQRYTTQALGYGLAERIRLERPTADIAYVVVQQHADSEIQLDNLHFGISTQTVTNRLGAYHLPGLPEGTYRVQVVAPPQAPPVTQIHTVTIGEGEAASGVDFAALAPAWQNSVDRFDVMGNGYVTPMDVLAVINYINANVGQLAVDPSRHSPPPFYDVDGDGYVTPADVLAVINHLNLPPASDAGASVIDVTGGNGGAPQGEGESSAEQAWWWAESGESPRTTCVAPQRPQLASHGKQTRNLPEKPVRPARDGYFRDLARLPSETPTQRKESNGHDPIEAIWELHELPDWLPGVLS